MVEGAGVGLNSLRDTHWMGLNSCALFLRQNQIAALYCSFRIFLVAALILSLSLSSPVSRLDSRLSNLLPQPQEFPID